MLLHKIQVVRADTYNESVASRRGSLDDAEVTKVKEVERSEGYDSFWHGTPVREPLCCVLCADGLFVRLLPS